MSGQQDLGTRGEQNNDMEDAEIAHLAGVFDAVGVVTVQISKNDKYSIGYQFQAMVKLSRPMANNDPLMGKILAYCDQQGVNYGLSEQVQEDVGGKSHLFVIKNPESIQRFLEPMVPYFTTQYEPAMVMLEEIVPRMEDGLHTEKSGFLKLMEFVDMIRRSRRGSEPTYTKEYFEEEWSE